MGNSTGKWAKGLTRAQVATVQKLRGVRVGSTADGWSVFRTPTTIDPPTRTELRWRNASGKLMLAWEIALDGTATMTVYGGRKVEG